MSMFSSVDKRKNNELPEKVNMNPFEKLNTHPAHVKIWIIMFTVNVFFPP